jgi:protein-S-isoprenylcysteine O-methyltransferase Ste14
MTSSRLARLRVPLGFAAFALAFWLASPTPGSLVAGAAIAVVGQALRVWAAGHIEKGREVTRSGPYRLMRHPLYVGSAILGLGFSVAAASLGTVLLVMAYFLVTYVAAVRSEEATLDARFAGEYSAYREGRAEETVRRFSAQRAFGMNREYRSVAGLVGVFALLWLRV